MWSYKEQKGSCSDIKHHFFLNTRPMMSQVSSILNSPYCKMSFMKGTNYYIIQCTLSDHTFIFTICKNLHICTADQEEQENNLQFFLFPFLLAKPSTQLLNGIQCTRLMFTIL